MCSHILCEVGDAILFSAAAPSLGSDTEAVSIGPCLDPGAGQAPKVCLHRPGAGGLRQSLIGRARELQLRKRPVFSRATHKLALFSFQGPLTQFTCHWAQHPSPAPGV